MRRMWRIILNAVITNETTFPGDITAGNTWFFTNTMVVTTFDQSS